MVFQYLSCTVTSKKTWCWQPNYQYLGMQPYLEIRLKAKSSGWILIQYEIWTGSRLWEERWWEWHPRQRIRVMLPQAKGCWRLPAEWWSWEAAFHRTQLCLVTYFKGLTFESSFRFQEKLRRMQSFPRHPCFSRLIGYLTRDNPPNP